MIQTQRQGFKWQEQTLRLALTYTTPSVFCIMFSLLSWVHIWGLEYSERVNIEPLKLLSYSIASHLFCYLKVRSENMLLRYYSKFVLN